MHMVGVSKSGDLPVMAFHGLPRSLREENGEEGGWRVT